MRIVLVGPWTRMWLRLRLRRSRLRRSGRGRMRIRRARVRPAVREAILDRTPDALEAARGSLLLNLGVVALNADRHRDAIDPLRRAVDVLETTFGDEHPDVALAMINLGEALARAARESKRPEELAAALDAQRAALEASRTINGPEHPETAMAESNLAWTLSRDGRCREAIPLATHAVAISSREDLPLAQSYPLQVIGICHLDHRRFDQAISTLERVVALRADADPLNRAESRRYLAIALLGRGRRDEAVAQMRERRGEPAAAAESVEAIDRWLQDPAGQPP
jgi:tetratricopeptide (TPR) repeat protein